MALRVFNNPLYQPIELLGPALGRRGCIPRALLRELFWPRVVIAALLLGGIGVPTGLLVLGAAMGIWIVPWYLPWAWLAIYVPVAHVWPAIVNRRFVRRLREDELRTCLECGQSLRGLPSEHACPECGHTYRLEDVARAWSRRMELTGKVEK
jgi:predicted RNA-binding Zn-ribbon protein involved in translation (DUF1610 family)